MLFKRVGAARQLRFLTKLWRLLQEVCDSEQENVLHPESNVLWGVGDFLSTWSATTRAKMFQFPMAPANIAGFAKSLAVPDNRLALLQQSLDKYVEQKAVSHPLKQEENLVGLRVHLVEAIATKQRQ